jgi:hypothetical protein
MANNNNFPPTESTTSPLERPAPEVRKNRLASFGKSVQELVFKRKDKKTENVADNTEPEHEIVTENWDDVRAEIENDSLLEQVPEHDRHEALVNTYELYRVAREKVAPVITGFADSLLEEASNKQIIFAARDGLGAYKAASILKEKFDYANKDPEQLVYAYLTRKVVYGTASDTLKEYLHQVGVGDTDADIILADIGMYGTILPAMQRMLPHMQPHYLISKTPEVPGYATNMTSVEEVIGNPAIHFLEDTFSGPIPSPTELVDTGNGIEPNTVHETFPPEEMLKRKYGLKAIEDYVVTLKGRPAQPPVEAMHNLDMLLSDSSAYQHLMVPHAR